MPLSYDVSTLDTVKQIMDLSVMRFADQAKENEFWEWNASTNFLRYDHIASLCAGALNLINWLKWQLGKTSFLSNVVVLISIALNLAQPAVQKYFQGWYLKRRGIYLGFRKIVCIFVVAAVYNSMADSQRSRPLQRASSPLLLVVLFSGSLSTVMLTVFYWQEFRTSVAMSFLSLVVMSTISPNVCSAISSSTQNADDAIFRGAKLLNAVTTAIWYPGSCLSDIHLQASTPYCVALVILAQAVFAVFFSNWIVFIAEYRRRQQFLSDLVARGRADFSSIQPFFFKSVWEINLQALCLAPAFISAVWSILCVFYGVT